MIPQIWYVISCNLGIRKSKQTSLKIKLRIFDTNMKTVLLYMYGSKTCRVTKDTKYW